MYFVASSLYHAIPSLLKLGKADETLTETSKAIQRDFQVNDILTGGPTEQKPKQIQASLINTLKIRQLCSEPRVIL